MKRLTLAAALLFAFAAHANPVVVVDGAAYCAGVAVTPQHIVTNQHCTDKMATVAVKTQNGQRFIATVVAESSTDDLAVVKVEPSVLDPVTFGEITELRVGSPVTAVGHPNKNNWVTTTGAAIGMALVDKTQLYVLHSAQTDVGNSGGALYDARGQLIGINAALSKRGHGSLAVPITIVVKFLEQAGVR